MALSLTWSLLARRVVAVLGLVLFLAVGVLVFSRNAMRADMPTFLEDGMIIPRAYTKGIGSLAPLVRLEIEAETVSAHLVEDGEHATIYVISRDTGYVARGHRRRLDARERKDAAFAFATIEFEDMARRMVAASEALGEPPRSVEIIRPAGAAWLLWRMHGSKGQVEFGKDGVLIESAAASVTE